MFDRTGQTVRLREGAVPTVFVFTGNRKPLVVGKSTYERSNFATISAPKRISMNPDTNHVSVVPVSSESETGLQQSLGDTVVTSAASGTEPVARTSQSISADHTSSSDMRCSNTESGRDADVPSASSNDDENVAMDSPHVTGDESGNINGDLGTSPVAGDEIPYSARIPMVPGTEHLRYRRLSAKMISNMSYNVRNDHQYLPKGREDILMERLQESRARVAAHRKKNKLLQLKINRLQSRVAKLKEDLKTAKKNPTVSLLKSAVITVQKNSPNALRALLPKDNNVGENSVRNFTAT